MIKHPLQAAVLQHFEHCIANEGTLWRVAELEYFSTLLARQAHEVDQATISLESSRGIILTALKAVINERIGVKVYSSDYKFFLKELYQELGVLREEARKVLASLLEPEKTAPSIDRETCLVTLRSLQQDSLSIETIENVLYVLLTYLKQNTTQ